MDSNARALEQAIEAGEFGVIPGLAAAYRRSVVRELARTADGALRRALLQEAREKLNRSLQLAKARRARLAGRLAAAATNALPFEPPQHSLHTWQVEG